MNSFAHAYTSYSCALCIMHCILCVCVCGYSAGTQLALVWMSRVAHTEAKARAHCEYKKLKEEFIRALDSKEGILKLDISHISNDQTEQKKSIDEI